MKYILFLLGDESLPVAVLFAETLGHRAVADGLHVSPRSAGFVKLIPSPQTGSVFAAVYGESDTLGLRSLPEDGEVIEQMLR